MPDMFYDFVNKINFHDTDIEKKGLLRFVYQPLINQYTARRDQLQELQTTISQHNSMLLSPVQDDDELLSGSEYSQDFEQTKLDVTNQLQEIDNFLNKLNSQKSLLTTADNITQADEQAFIDLFSQKFPDIQVLTIVLSDAPEDIKQHLPALTLKILARSNAKEQEQQLQHLLKSDPALVKNLLQQSVNEYNKSEDPAIRASYRNLVQTILFEQAKILPILSKRDDKVSNDLGTYNFETLKALLPRLDDSDILDNIADYRSSEGQSFTQVFDSWKPANPQINFYKKQRDLMQAMHFGQDYLKDYMHHYQERLEADLFWARDIADLQEFDGQDLTDYYVQETILAEWMKGGISEFQDNGTSSFHNAMQLWLSDFECFEKKLKLVQKDPELYLKDPSIDQDKLIQYISARDSHTSTDVLLKYFQSLSEASALLNDLPSPQVMSVIKQSYKTMYNDELNVDFNMKKLKTILGNDKSVEEFVKSVVKYCINKVNAKVQIKRQSGEETFSLRLLYIHPADFVKNNSIFSVPSIISKELISAGSFTPARATRIKTQVTSFFIEENPSQKFTNVDELIQYLVNKREYCDSEITKLNTELNKVYPDSLNEEYWLRINSAENGLPKGMPLEEKEKETRKKFVERIRSYFVHNTELMIKRDLERNQMLSMACDVWINKLENLQKQKEFDLQNGKFKDDPLFKKLLALRQYKHQLLEFNLIDPTQATHLENLLSNPEDVMKFWQNQVDDVYIQISSFRDDDNQLGLLKARANKMRASYLARQDAKVKLQDILRASGEVDVKQVAALWRIEYAHHWKILGINDTQAQEAFIANMRDEIKHFSSLNQQVVSGGDYLTPEQEKLYFEITKQIKESLPADIQFEDVSFKIKYSTEGNASLVTVIVKDQDGKEVPLAKQIKINDALPYSLVKYPGMNEPLISFGGSRGNLAPIANLATIRQQKLRGRFGTSARGLGEGQYGFVKYARGLFSNQDFAVKSGFKTDQFTQEQRKDIRTRPITSRPDPLAKTEAEALATIAEIEGGAPSVYAEDGDKYVIVQPAAAGMTYADIGREAVKGYTKGQEEYHNPLKRSQKPDKGSEVRERVHMAQALLREMQKFSQDGVTQSAVMPQGVTQLAHNDIKPENFLVRRLDNDEYKVRLIDWATYGKTIVSDTQESQKNPELDIFGSAKNCTPLNIAPIVAFGRNPDSNELDDINIKKDLDGNPMQPPLLGADPQMDNYALTTNAFGIIHRKAYFTIVSDRVIADYLVPGVLSEVNGKLDVKSDDVGRYNEYFACEDRDKLLEGSSVYEDSSAVMYVPTSKREGEPFHLYRYLKDIVATTSDEPLKLRINQLLEEVRHSISKGCGLDKHRLDQVLREVDDCILQYQNLNQDVKKIQEQSDEVSLLLKQYASGPLALLTGENLQNFRKICLNSTTAQEDDVIKLIRQIDGVAILADALVSPKSPINNLLVDCIQHGKSKIFHALLAQFESVEKSSDVANKLKQYIKTHDLIRLAIQNKDFEAIKQILSLFKHEEIQGLLTKVEASSQLDWRMDALQYVVLSGDDKLSVALLSKLLYELGFRTDTPQDKLTEEKKEDLKRLLQPALLTAAKLGRVNSFTLLLTSMSTYNISVESIVNLKDKGWSAYHHLLKHKSSLKELHETLPPMNDAGFLNSPPYPLLIVAKYNNVTFLKHCIDKAFETNPIKSSPLFALDENNKNLLNHLLDNQNYAAIDNLLQQLVAKNTEHSLIKTWLLNPSPNNPLANFINDPNVPDAKKNEYFVKLLDAAYPGPRSQSQYNDEFMHTRLLALAMQQDWILAELVNSDEQRNATIKSILRSPALNNEYKYCLKSILLKKSKVTQSVEKQKIIGELLNELLPSTPSQQSFTLLSRVELELLKMQDIEFGWVQNILDFTEQSENLVTENETMLYEIDVLRSELDNLVKVRYSQNNIQAQLVSLQNKHDQIIERIRDLKSTYSSVPRSGSQDTSDDLSILENLLQQQQFDLNENQLQMEVLEADNTKLGSRVLQLEVAHKALNRLLEERSRESAEEFESAQALLSSQDSEILTLKILNQNLDKQLVAKIGEAEVVQEELANARLSIKSLDSQMIDLHKKLEYQQLSMDAVSAESLQQESKIAELQTSLREFQASKDLDLQEKQSRIQQLEADLSSAHKKLEEDAGNLDKFALSLSAMHIEKASLLDSVKQLEAQQVQHQLNDNGQALVSDFNSTVYQLIAEKAELAVSALQTQLQSFSQQLVEAKKHNQDLINNNQELRQENQQLQQENVGLKEEVQVLSAELFLLRAAQLQFAEQQSRQEILHEEKVSQLQLETVSLQQEITRLKESVVDFMDTSSQLLDSKNVIDSTRLQEHAQKISALEDELSLNQEQQSDLQQSLDESRAEVLSQKQERMALEDKLSSVSSELAQLQQSNSVDVTELQSLVLKLKESHAQQIASEGQLSELRLSYEELTARNSILQDQMAELELLLQNRDKKVARLSVSTPVNNQGITNVTLETDSSKEELLGSLLDISSLDRSPGYDSSKSGTPTRYEGAKEVVTKEDTTLDLAPPPPTPTQSIPQINLSKIPSLLKLIAHLPVQSFPAVPVTRVDITRNANVYYKYKNYLSELKTEIDREFQSLTDEQKGKLFNDARDSKLAFNAAIEGLAKRDGQELLKIATHYKSSPSIFTFLGLTEAQCAFLTDKEVGIDGKIISVADQVRQAALNEFNKLTPEKRKNLKFSPVPTSFALPKEIAEIKKDLSYFFSPEFRCSLGMRADEMKKLWLPIMNDIEQIKSQYEQWALNPAVPDNVREQLNENLQVINSAYTLLHGNLEDNSVDYERVGIKEFLSDAAKLEAGLALKVGNITVRYTDFNKDSNPQVPVAQQCRNTGNAWTVASGVGHEDKSAFSLATQLHPSRVRRYNFNESGSSNPFAHFTEERSTLLTNSRYTITKFPSGTPKTTEEKDDLHNKRVQFAMLMMMQVYAKLDKLPSASSPLPIQSNDKTQLKYLATAAYLIQQSNCERAGIEFDPKAIKIYTKHSNYSKDDWVKATGLNQGSCLPWRSSESFITRFQSSDFVQAARMNIDIGFARETNIKERLKNLRQGLYAAKKQANLPEDDRNNNSSNVNPPSP